jgi:hypothetical protein
MQNLIVFGILGGMPTHDTDKRTSWFLIHEYIFNIFVMCSVSRLCFCVFRQTCFPAILEKIFWRRIHFQQYLERSPNRSGFINPVYLWILFHKISGKLSCFINGYHHYDKHKKLFSRYSFDNPYFFRKKYGWESLVLKSSYNREVRGSPGSSWILVREMFYSVDDSSQRKSLRHSRGNRRSISASTNGFGQSWTVLYTLSAYDHFTVYT